MSEQELYEIARKRIDRRNRRLTFWSINLLGLMASLGVFLALTDTPYVMLALGGFLVWCGVLTMHSVILWMSETRDNDIQKEVAKLRSASYEKPKRLHLSEDGELADEEEQHARQSQAV